MNHAIYEMMLECVYPQSMKQEACLSTDFEITIMY